MCAHKRPPFIGTLSLPRHTHTLALTLLDVNAL